MKGPTLHQRWGHLSFRRPAVSKFGHLWFTACDLDHGRIWKANGRPIPWARSFPTHAEALAAANAHALEHLIKDTARWAADEFAVGSEVWQEDQQ